MKLDRFHQPSFLDYSAYLFFVLASIWLAVKIVSFFRTDSSATRITIGNCIEVGDTYWGE